eukprot:GFUD01011929.1.p1 GENE.GFUD01011929.1~~GFUD01011929.1.p1  ORF type:complete len:274 (+),score=71.61 GFUD01011929.1:225-1046(+)
MPYMTIPSLELQDLCKASPLPHSLQQAHIFSYDTEVFPFREQVATILRTEGELGQLHNTEAGMTALARGTKKRRNDQFVKIWRSSLGSEARKEFNKTLHQFVDTFISPRMSCKDPPEQAAVAYQKEPTIRVVLPSDQAPTPLHCDADYHHPPAEVNWWLPLTSVRDSNSLYIESRPGEGDFLPVELGYGQVLRFYGNLCQHYTVPNTSSVTRVSLDLRVLALEHHDLNWRDRMGRSSIYTVGKYYIRAGGGKEVEEIEMNEIQTEEANILLQG